MAKVLTDGEREIIADLVRDWDAEGDEQSEYSGAWCHGCDNPVEECHCRPVAATARASRREAAHRAIMKALELQPIVIRVNYDFWAVASGSRPGAGYLVERDPATGDLYCPCKAAEFTGCCYHRAAVGLALSTIPAPWIPTRAFTQGNEYARMVS